MNSCSGFLSHAECLHRAKYCLLGFVTWSNTIEVMPILSLPKHFRLEWGPYRTDARNLRHTAVVLSVLQGPTLAPSPLPSQTPISQPSPVRYASNLGHKHCRTPALPSQRMQWIPKVVELISFHRIAINTLLDTASLYISSFFLLFVRSVAWRLHPHSPCHYPRLSQHHSRCRSQRRSRHR